MWKGFTRAIACVAVSVAAYGLFPRGLRQGNWKIAWGKRMPEEPSWELFDLSVDRSEQNHLAVERPELTQALAAEWMAWAERIGAQVNPPKSGNQLCMLRWLIH